MTVEISCWEDAVDAFMVLLTGRKWKVFYVDINKAPRYNSSLWWCHNIVMITIPDCNWGVYYHLGIKFQHQRSCLMAEQASLMIKLLKVFNKYSLLFWRHSFIILTFCKAQLHPTFFLNHFQRSSGKIGQFQVNRLRSIMIIFIFLSYLSWKKLINHRAKVKEVFIHILMVKKI